MIMANRENMEKWAQALESGDYKQGFGTLCRVINGQGRYCCLGVACEVALANGVELTITTKVTGQRTYDGSEGFLPWKVSEWLGLGHNGDPVLTPARQTATELNDGDAASFTQIAAMIRAAYLSDTEQEN